MKISLTLIHNKTPQENEAQVSSLKSLLTEVVDGPFLNEETRETWTTIHHELVGLNIPHEVRVYQVIPFGVTPPVNRYEINSGGIVQYGIGDEDKIGTHPRFFNWGLKRGTDNGADISIYLEDVSKFEPTKLKFDKDFSEEVFGKIASLNLLKTKGQLDEDKPIDFDKYKEVKNG